MPGSATLPTGLFMSSVPGLSGLPMGSVITVPAGIFSQSPPRQVRQQAFDDCDDCDDYDYGDDDYGHDDDGPCDMDSDDGEGSRH